MKILRDKFGEGAKGNVKLQGENGPDRLIYFQSEDYTVFMDCISEYVHTMRREDDYCEIKILLWEKYAPALIGKKGAVINALREKHGSLCTIQIYSKPCPQSTDRVCRIGGSRSTVMAIISDIFETIGTEEKPQDFEQRFYNTANFDLLHVDDYGGYSLERGAGARVPKVQKFGGASPMHPNMQQTQNQRMMPMPTSQQMMPSYEKLFFMAFGQFPPPGLFCPEVYAMNANNMLAGQQAGGDWRMNANLQGGPPAGGGWHLM